MSKIALITEGITDQAVIENILYGYFDEDEPIIRPLFPEDKDDYSGWELVLKFCSSNAFKEAFQFNDYLVVQIDTDVSEEKNFGVAKTEKGVELSPDELIEKVKTRLIREITPETYEIYKDKIIFAICVHSLECWLLPLVEPDLKKAAATKDCLNRVKRSSKEGLNKDYKSYDKISRTYLKPKKLNELAPKNPSLKIFMDELLLKVPKPTQQDT